MDLKRKLEYVRSRIAAACSRAGRSPGDVTLVVVTKTVGRETIDELISLGVRDFGENRVQDAAAKFTEGLPADLRLHMIGHLQTNKARQAVRLASMIHSIDSLRLAEAVSREAAAAGKTAPVLLEVNVSGEESKYGFDAESAMQAAPQVAALPGLRLGGLMTMAPLGAGEAELRAVFGGLRKLAGRISVECGLPMPHLSMGMSQDYETAIEEGATIIRVGTAIVGSASHGASMSR